MNEAILFLAEGAAKPPEGYLPNWVVIAGMTALTGVIGVLWKLWIGSVTKTIEHQAEKLDKCEEDHEATRKKFLEISRDHGELSGRLQGLEASHQLIYEKLHSKQAHALFASVSSPPFDSGIT